MKKQMLIALFLGAPLFVFAEFELVAGNDSPTGKFDSIGKFTTQNILFPQKPYQGFTFSKVTAKYFKFKILNSHGGSELK